MRDIAILLQQTAARPCTTPTASVTSTTRHLTPTPRASTFEAAIPTDAVIIIRILVAITRTVGSVIITDIIQATAMTTDLIVTDEVECITPITAIIMYFNRVDHGTWAPIWCYVWELRSRVNVRL